jgi:transposase-like protein
VYWWQGRECPGSRPSKYSEEFRADAFALVLTTGDQLAQAGRDLGVNPETLAWMAPITSTLMLCPDSRSDR